MNNTTFEQSPGDQNQYDYFQLDNGIKVILVQDNNQKQIEQGGSVAYVSIAVNAGSFNDFMHRQGIAHFLEHMIFMGSEKYPGENEWGEFLTRNGGETNAFTEFEYTNYQFKIGYQGLQKALDMQAWLFAKPLLAKDSMTREIQAVESEFKSQFANDQTRQMQILCENTKDPDHLLNRFSWGNFKSLVGKNQNYQSLWDDLWRFYKENYCAQRMSVVVQVKSDDNMQQVRQWVTQSFSIIPNIPDISSKQNFKTQLPFDPSTVLLINSVRDQNTMTIYYQFESDIQRRNVKKSYFYVNQIVGHEGQGSLYQRLQQNNLAEELCTEITNSFITCFDLIQIEITLTSLGLQKYEEVLSLVHEYLDQLLNWTKEQQICLFEESKFMSEIGFKQAYKVCDPWDNVTELATELLFTQDISKILKQTYSVTQLNEIDIKDISYIISQMTYQNCKVILSSKNICQLQSQKCRWFQTTFSTINKPQQINFKGTGDFQKPHPNQFIPKNTKILYAGDAQQQNQIEERKIQNCTFYICQDRVFLKPKMNLIVCLVTPSEHDHLPEYLSTPRNVAQFFVALDCLMESVNKEVGYDAQLADVYYDVKNDEDFGIKLLLSGYQSTLIHFADLFIQKILYYCSNKFDSNQIQVSQHKLRKQFKNINVEVSDTSDGNRLTHLLTHRKHLNLINQQLATAQDFDPSKVLAQIVRQVVHVKGLAHGNVDCDQVEQFFQNLVSKLKITGKPWQFGQQIAEINQCCRWDFVVPSVDGAPNDVQDQQDEEMEDSQEQNSSDEVHDVTQEDCGSNDQEDNCCVDVYFQAPTHDFGTRCCLQLLSLSLADKFFDQVRTQDQFGYDVSCSDRNTRGVCGFLFHIQSASKNPIECEQRIRKFVEEFEFTKEMYEEFKAAILTKKRAGFRDQSEEFKYLIDCMNTMTTQPNNPVQWDLRHQEIQFFDSQCTYEQVNRVMNQVITKNKNSAVYSVFSQRHAHLASNFDMQSKADQGQVLAHQTLKCYRSV